MVCILAVTRYSVLALVVLQVLHASSAQAAGDPEKGAQIFRRCSACHSVQEGNPNKAGPGLFGIIGRKVASLPGYMYSPAMESADFVWTEDKLVSFLTHPQQVLAGTRMPFMGLSRVEDASNIVAYLASFK
jgi:cytochrome c